MPVLAGIGPFGPWELALILLIVVLIFGVGRLPEVGGAVGKGIREFRKSTKDGDDADDSGKEADEKDDGAAPPPSASSATAEPPSAASADSAFCTECGTANARDAKFCQKCGHAMTAGVS